jgi:serine/threonine-protein kinase
LKIMQAPPIATGTLLQNRYRLVGVADQGHFGQTYLARDIQQGNELYVLKEFLPPEPEPEAMQSLWQQFNQLSAVLYSLHHPQLPKFQALIAQDHRFYWVRDYVEGESYGVLLEERSAAGQVFTESEVLQLMAQVLPVLHYLHSRGVVHRNVTPASLIQREPDGLPVLVNFGLVYELVAQLRLHPVDPAVAVGRWGYTPPEQVSGTPCPASDLFALAVTVIVLLSGKLPEELYNAETQIFEWEASVTATSALKQLLGQMLDPNPQKRPAVAMELLPILRSLMAHPQPNPPRNSTNNNRATVSPKRRSRDRRRRGTDLTASMLLGAGLSSLFLVVAWRALSSWGTLPFLNSSPSSSTPPAVTASSPKPSLIPEQQQQPVPEQTTTPIAEASTPANSDGLRDRRRELEIEYNFFTQLVDELFYAKYPQLRAQQLGAEAQQESLKNEWNAIANSLMDRLAKLPAENRRKLGSYRRDNYSAWLAQLGETGNSSKTLDPLADARFYELFPEMKGKSLAPRTFGQIWYAIAEEQLSRAKTQQAGGRAQPTSN